jgi:hypothetical protein
MPAVAQSSTGPSFDCARASRPVEHAICASPDLSALDRELARRYGAHLRDLPRSQAERLQAEQRVWLRDRDRCGQSEACLGAGMKARMAVFARPGAGDGEPDAIMPDAATARSRSGEERGTRVQALSATPVDAAPRLNHADLLRLYMAANGVILDTDAFAFEHHAITAGGRYQSPACHRIGQALASEIDKADLVAEARRELGAALKQAATWPKTMVFRVEAEATVRSYDSALAAFPVSVSASDSLTALRPARSVSDRDRPRGAARADHCQAGLIETARLRGANVLPMAGNGVFPRFRVDIRNIDVLERIALTVEDARALLQRLGDDRTIELELAVEIGPAAIRRDLDRQGAPRKPGDVLGRIVSANALLPRTGEVLHRFPVPALDAKTAGEQPATAAAPNTRPAPETQGPASATDTRAAAPLPRSAQSALAPPAVEEPKTATAKPVDFGAVAAPDRESLLRLVMAAHADLVDTPGFAWRRFVESRLPALGFRTPACTAFWRDMDNEFERPGRIEVAHRLLREELAGLKGGPASMLVRLRAEARRLDYVEATGAFPLDEMGNAWLWGHGAVALPARAAPRRRGADREVRCTSIDAPPGVGFSSPALAIGNLPGHELYPEAFSLRLPRSDVFSSLPMDRETARSFVRSKGGQSREVVVEVVVEVTPSRNSSTAARLGQLDGRVVAARMLDTGTGRVLHEIDAEAAAAATARLVPAPPPVRLGSPLAVVARPDETKPASRHRLALLALRHEAEPLSRQTVLKLTEEQIRSEQRIWQALRQRRDDIAESLVIERDPRRPARTFEWQRLAGERPDLAAGPVLQLFLDDENGWDFVRREPGFDPDVKHRLGVFLFDRRSILGREPQAIAEELEPVYRRHLEAAIAASPRTLTATAALPEFQYDPGQRLLLMPERGLLQPSQGYAVAPAAEAHALYHPSQSDRPRERDGEGLPEFAQKSEAGAAAAHHWRNGVSSAMRRFAIALDRRLVLDGLSIEPAQVRAIEASLREGRTRRNLAVRVTFDVDDVQAARPSVPEHGAVYAISRLRRVDILLPDGEVLASLDASRFPLESDARAREAATAAAERAKTAAREAALRAERIATLEARKTAEADRKRLEAQAQATAAAALKRHLTAQALRPDGAFGPSLVGLRLGMSIVEAEAVIRGHMAVGAVIEHDPKGWGAEPTLLGRRIFSTADGDERIALFTHDSVPGRVAAVSRRLGLPQPAPSPARLRQMLTDSFGEPQISQAPAEFVWASGALERCRVDISTHDRNQGYLFVEGGVASLRSPGGSESSVEASAIANATIALPLALSNRGDDRLDEILGCPTTLLARADLRSSDPFLRFTLVDGGWLAAASAAARSAGVQANQASTRALIAGPSEPSATPPAPAAAGARDILGITLGMDFGEAERRVRAHMDVGTVLTGAGAVSDSRAAREDWLYASGRLFIASDGSEMIAIHDEPLAGPGKVAAIRRRLHLPAGQASIASIADGLEAKYGKADEANPLRQFLLWGTPRISRCGIGFTPHMRPFTEEWYENGAPARWQPPNGLPVEFNQSFLGVLKEQPDLARANSCGPTVTSVIWPGRGQPATDVIETTLADHRAYLQSRRRGNNSAAAPDRSEPRKGGGKEIRF